MVWTKEAEQFLRDNYINRGMNYCVEQLGATPAAIRHKASKLQLKRRGKGRQPRVIGLRDGYLAISSYNRREAIRRLALEEKLGRKLQPWEIVHHKDGNKKNNDPNNLEIVTRGEHMKLHNRPRDEKGRFL